MSEQATEQVWVEDRSYIPLADEDGAHVCSMRGCRRGAVACFRRGVTRWDHNPPTHWTRRWYCCPLHLYGRKFDGSRVLTGVAPGSIAAKRGYVY